MDSQDGNLCADSAAEARPQLEWIAGPLPDASEETPPASVDAWLERRLRVFERALTGLEARQEKSEQDLLRRIAMLEERVAVLENRQAPAQEAVPLQQDQTLETAPQLALAFESQNAEPQARPRIGDFLAHARRAANEATASSPLPPVKAKGAPRWMAWTAVGCAAAMTVTALVLGTVAGASVPAGGVAHRQPAEAFGRVVARADSGDPKEQTALALAYLRGEHFAPDHDAAKRWAQAAAEQGDPMAQYLTGAFYQSGEGTAADPAKAFHWFEASALRGNIKAMHNLAIAYAEGKGTAPDAERAAAWFNRAAEEGYKDSQFDLAVLYERGDGVKQNPQSALKWYLIAAHAGDSEAQTRAQQLEQAMAAADVSQAEDQAGQFVATTHDLAANSY